MDGLTKEEKKLEIKKYRDNISGKLQEIKESKIPFVIIVEGWHASGKGMLVNELIKNIDPRFYSVFVEDSERLEDRYPFMYPYFNAIPENGKFTFYEGAYMQNIVDKCFTGEIPADLYRARLRNINNFERQLKNNGYVVIKMFLDVSKKEQAKRLKELNAAKETGWRLNDKSYLQNANHKAWKKAFKSFIEDTSYFAPWHVIEAESKTEIKYQGFKILSDAIDEALKNGKYNGEEYKEEFKMQKTPLLKDVDLSVTISEEEYKKKLDELQTKVAKLHNLVHRNRIPVIVAFEGWDAAGKGGAIRRLAYPLDPRGFDVEPIASPDQYEKARHHLWRFYKRLPKSGHVTIFDRTWYGRVMVERLEGFCTENDWKRAYNEINEFEETLTSEGAVVLKFWVHIDKDTQLARFTDRQNTPEKQWKITDEDWRNRDKWDDYEVAIDEMIQKTSTELAPWHIVESNDKNYARIKVLEIVAEELEKAVNKAK